MESSLRLTNELFDDQENSGEVVSSETLRNEAEKWSLKGDLNLLCTLDKFSQDLASKSETMQKNLDQITYESKMKAVKVKNLINDFQMLENCQFIENRVYDEEVEDVIANGAMNSSDEQPKGDDPEKVKQNIKKSLDAGFRFIENSLNGFRQVNDKSFDSEEEEDCVSANLAAMLKENRFNKTPLPHIVGSDMFMRDTFLMMSPENGTASTVDSGLKESYDDMRRDDEEYFSDESSFDHETFAKPIENHVEEPNDDGIFVCNGEAASNEEPFFDSIAKSRTSTNEHKYNKNDANIPDRNKDPFFETIRDESDEDDDLFGKLTKNRRASNASKTTTTTTNKVSNESKKLFDDLDDDDLFDIHPPTAKPATIIAASKPKTSKADANEVNAVDDDFDALNNSNFNDRLSSILGGQPAKKNPPPKNIAAASSEESIEESSKTSKASTHESDSNKTNFTSTTTKKNNEPLRIESDSDDDLFGKSSKNTSRPSSAPKITARKLSSDAKNLFADVDDIDFSKTSKESRKNSKLSIFDDDENDDLFGAIQKANKTSSKPADSMSASDALFGSVKKSDTIKNSTKSSNSVVVNTESSKRDSKNSGVKPTNDLFAEADDDDLFAITKKTSTSTSSSKPSVTTTKPTPPVQTLNSPDDSDVEDDSVASNSSSSNFKNRLNSILGAGPKKQTPPKKVIVEDSSDDPLLESKSTEEPVKQHKPIEHKKVSVKSSDVIVPEPRKDTFFEPVCDDDADSEDDLFDKFLKRPEKTTLTNNSTASKPKSSETRNLFDDLDDDDDDDDDDTDSSAKVAPKTSKVNLFVDDDNDDLFSFTAKTEMNRSTQPFSKDVNTSSKPKLEPKELGVKLAGDLFANTDDDDLFSLPKNAPKATPAEQPTSKPLSLNRVSNSNDISVVENSAPLNNSMFKDRAKLGAQRRKRNPTRKPTTAAAVSIADDTDSEKPLFESVEEPALRSMEEKVCIVRGNSKDTFFESNSDLIDSSKDNFLESSKDSFAESSKAPLREPLLNDSDGDSEDDLFGKSSKRTTTANRPSSAPKSTTATVSSKISVESKKLFDDLDDDLFSQSSKVRRDSKLKMFAGDESDDLFGATSSKTNTNTKANTERIVSKPKLADPLFDDDDDDLFSRK